MLSSISWQHYLAAIILLTITYYGYVIFRYYQKEVSLLFNRKQQPADLFSAEMAAPFQVMGPARLDDGIIISPSEELLFTEPSPDDMHSTENNNPPVTTLVLTPAQELQLEASNLIDAFQEIDDKPEFVTLLRILLNSYQRFEGEIDFQAVLAYVAQLAKEKLMFPLSLTDLQEIKA